MPPPSPDLRLCASSLLFCSVFRCSLEGCAYHTDSSSLRLPRAPERHIQPRWHWQLQVSCPVKARVRFPSQPRSFLTYAPGLDAFFLHAARAPATWDPSAYKIGSLCPLEKFLLSWTLLPIITASLPSHPRAPQSLPFILLIARSILLTHLFFFTRLHSALWY
jgi:hypothetical protein